MAMKIGGGDPKSTSVKRSAKPAAKKAVRRNKAFGKKTAAAAKGKTSKPATGFPRTTWQDGAKLGKEISRSQTATAQHPRIHHAKPNTGAGHTGGTVNRPPIAMKYGVARPDVTPPPIAMKYGVARPDPKPPPIAMRYGVVRPDPDQPPAPPPIAMKYGVARPDVKPPPIAMKYGVPRAKH